MGIYLSTAATKNDWATISTTFAVCSLLLHLIVKAPNFYALPSERPTEDEPIKEFLPIPKLMKYPASETKRRQRIHANTVENCYFDFATFWAAFLGAFIQSIGSRAEATKKRKR